MRSTSRLRASMPLDYFLRGIASLHSWTKESNDEALRLFNKAIELNSRFRLRLRHGFVVLRPAQRQSLDNRPRARDCRSRTTGSPCGGVAGLG